MKPGSTTTESRRSEAMGESYEDTMREIVESVDGWTLENEAVLVCPHGNRIEPDGRCPDGCESPLITMGLI